jgi:glycerol dehydrogenase-like iron-containing ADH family enzyme
LEFAEVDGHRIEIANWTAVKDWKLSYKLHNEYYGEYAASIAKLVLP